MAIKRIDRLLEPDLLPSLRRIGTTGLAEVPRRLVAESVNWEGADYPVVQLTVLESGGLEIDIICNERDLVGESSAWSKHSFSAEIEGHGRLSVREAIAREIGRTAAGRKVRVHATSWQLAASGRRPSSTSCIWCASIDFGITDQPHLLELGSGNLDVWSGGENIKGWCFETARGLAFVVRSNARKQWYVAFRTKNGSAPTFDQVTELAAMLAFALGQPFAVGVFHCVDRDGVIDLERLNLPDWRSRDPSRRAPGLPAIDGGYWLARFVGLGIEFLANEPSAPLLTAIHHSIDSFDSILDTEFLHIWIAAEALAKWGMQHRKLRDGGQLRIADHDAWLAWVHAHETDIKAHAVAGMEQQLLDRVRASELDRPTPVQRAFRGEGITWTTDLQEIELARHGVTHEGSMSGPIAYDMLVNIKKVGVALNVLGTLIAKLIGYDGPLSDRSTRRLPLSTANAPSWWKSTDDYELVTYSDDRPAEQSFSTTPTD